MHTFICILPCHVWTLFCGILPLIVHTWPFSLMCDTTIFQFAVLATNQTFTISEMSVLHLHPHHPFSGKLHWRRLKLRTIFAMSWNVFAADVNLSATNWPLHSRVTHRHPRCLHRRHRPPRPQQSSWWTRQIRRIENRSLRKNQFSPSNRWPSSVSGCAR